MLFECIGIFSKVPITFSDLNHTASGNHSGLIEAVNLFDVFVRIIRVFGVSFV